MSSNRVSHWIVVLAVLAVNLSGRTAAAEDNSILQGLYGYWSLDANDNPVYVNKFRDDGTLLHAADYQFTADADQGRGLKAELVPGILNQAVLLRGKERPFEFDVPLPGDSPAGTGAGSPRRLTVSLWTWMDQRRDDAVLFSNTAMQHFGYGEFRFRVLADGITVNFGVFDPRDTSDYLGSSEVMATRTPFPLKKWQHIVLVIDEPQAWLYLNGREIGHIRLTRQLQMAVIKTVTFGDCRRRWPVDDAPIRTEWDLRTAFQPWSGKIDEVAMWTRPLTAAEVRGVYAATLAGKPVFDAVAIPSLWESSTFRFGMIALVTVVLGVVLHKLVTRQLRRRLSTAESRLLLDAERQRIADDIHDELGARLAKLSLISEMAAREGRPDRLLTVSSTARDAARSLDELVWTLKPIHDTLADFAGYLTDAASELLEGTNIALRLHIPDDLPNVKIAPNVRRDLMLIWKESMANAMKHAQAKEITVCITLVGTLLTMSTADNGIGLPEPTPPEPKHATGNGLRTMCDRMGRLGGRCDIRPREGGGTVVEVSLKLH
jgi:signal transduction histidine kinase